MLSVRPSALRALVVIAPLLTALALPCSSLAQTTSASISGTVVDPEGKTVPGATVTIIDERTNETRVTVSDAERGTFQITNLAPGTYTVRIALQGFRTFERKGVVVSSSERVSVGSLSLWLSDAEKRRVWMGYARAEIQIGLSREERLARLREAIAGMLAHFPPKQRG